MVLMVILCIVLTCSVTYHSESMIFIRLNDTSQHVPSMFRPENHQKRVQGPEACTHVVNFPPERASFGNMVHAFQVSVVVSTKKDWRRKNMKKPFKSVSDVLP